MSAVISVCITKNIKIGEFSVPILILKMEEDTRFWHSILYYFKKGKNTTEMQNKICEVNGEGAVTYQTCQKWFAVLCWRFLPGQCSMVR